MAPLKLKGPFRAMLIAPSCGGKTTYLFSLIDNRDKIIDPPVKKIIYHYSVYQDIFKKYEKIVEFKQGEPKCEDLKNLGFHYLVIMDDLLSEMSAETTKIATVQSHHKNFSFIVLSQNIFQKGPHNRNLNLSASYIILFKQTRDMTQVHCLARQLMPHNSKFIVESYLDATKEPYKPFFIDLTQTCPDILRYRGDILATEQVVYIPNERVDKKR
jgi:hypothetical protein